jgi:tetratricopeptide (TPR) repeat protein
MRSLGRLGDATRERDRLVAEFEESAVPVERSWVLRALQEKANLLFEAGDFAAAATTNQRVIQLAQREPDSELREYLAVGMARHARALEALGRWPEVEQTCDEMVALLGKANNLSIEEQVAATLSQYGIALRAQGHRERALARAEQVISTFGGCPAHGELSSIMARTRLEQVELLQLMKRGDAAEAADAALAQIADHRVREKVRARVMSASASAYVAAGRLSDAVDVADELVSEFGNSDNETLRQDVVLGLNNKLVALAAQGLTEDAERAYETMVEDFGQQAADALGTVVEELQPATDEQSRLQIAGLLTRQAMVLNDVGQREAALGVVNAVIKEGESETGAASAQVLAAARAIREAIEG